MIDQELLYFVAASGILESAYWVCLVAGGGLLAVSTLLGGDADADVGLDTDVSFDGDIDLDAGLDADLDVSAADVDIDTGADVTDVGSHAEAVHASSLATWFSMRFLIFFAATFGAVGVIMTHLMDVSRNLVLVSSLVVGVVVGQGVHQLFRKLRKSSGNSLVQVQDYVNQLARVTVAIDNKKKGEVAVEVRGGRRYIAAVAKHGEGHFKTGDIVAVVEYAAGLAEVVSREEHEFLNNPKGGQS